MPEVEFAVGSAYAFDFPDGSVDVVHAHQLLHHLARPVEALREFRRVAGQHGLVAVRETDYAAKTIYPESAGLRAWWAELYQRVHRAHGGEPDAGRRLKAWARSASFTNVVAGGSVWVFADDEDRAFWGGMWADRSSPPPSPPTRSSSARQRRSCTRSATPGRHGPRIRTDGCRC